MRAHLLALAGFLAAAGCAESTLPVESELTDYRVLGIVADRPEVAPDAQVALTAVDFDPEGRQAGYVWSACFYSLGSRAKFQCADPSLEIPLPATGPTAVLDLAALDFEARFEAASPLVGLDGEVLSLDTGVDVTIGLTAGIPGQRATRMYKRVRVRRGDAPNQNPAVTAFEIEGDLRAGREVTLRITYGDDTPETYTEVQTGRTTTERMLVNFYADAGSLADRSPFDESLPDTTWTTPDEPGPAVLFAAIRDGRGGLTVLRRDVVVGPR
ncbi:MAG: hypothetical protein R3F60_20955 [bacterium]